MCIESHTAHSFTVTDKRSTTIHLLYINDLALFISFLFPAIRQICRNKRQEKKTISDYFCEARMYCVSFFFIDFWLYVEVSAIKNTHKLKQINKYKYVKNLTMQTSSTALLLSCLWVFPLSLHLIVAVSKNTSEGWNNE